nr:MAG TPA: shufflon protein [Bacteriophage sp.]
MVYIQTPSVTGLKHVVGTNPYTIWDSGNLTKLSQLTNDKGFVTGSVNGKTITINGTSTTWSNTWRPISDDYEKGDASTSLSTLGSLTLYNDLLSAIPTIPTIPNPTNYYWANIKVSSSSSTTTSPTVNVLTATRVCAGHDPGISNSISCSNWFRSSGETGWYSSTYGGGWYMSDKDWIRSWGSKALYVNNTIRSTNYQAMYGSTSVSAAKLESASSLVYGTDTSSNSINSYLRGTTVTLQVKKGTSINYNAL